jgi:DNA-binding NtrC family response regulator
MMGADQTNSQPKVSSRATLLVIRGPNIGVRYELGEHTRIGRDTTNEISLPDPSVSRLHAEIVRRRFAYIIRDCGSSNGVLVNGLPVQEKELLRNDEIQIGNTVFLFNADLRIESAIYSNSSVVLYPGDAVTQQIAADEPALEIPAGRDRALVEFMIKLADAFAVAPPGTSGVGARLLEHVLELFEANCAALFMRDMRTGKPRLALSLPEDVGALLERSSVMRAFEERRPVLTCDRPENLSRIPLAGDPENSGVSAEELQRGVTLMCVPITLGDSVVGVLAVAKFGLDCYSLKDLALLQAIAKLSSGTLRGAQLADYLELHPALTGTEWQLVPSRNPYVRSLFEQARRVAATDASVTITGPSGTGKEVLARFIHEASPRRQGPFVALNCGAIPSTLFESELFGYERGAFTGAARTTRGKIEAAHGGTFFLDEIGNLELSLQPKLLRFLQEHAFYRVGGTRPIEADVRIIAATNEDLEEAVKAGRFREDLWYRLNVVNFRMPPLAERREDIAPLAEYFLTKAAVRSGKVVLGLDDSALRLLERYPWPGNIRELANAIERAVILAEGTVLTAKDFAFLTEREVPAAPASPSETSGEVIAPLEEVERQHILRALIQCGWNQARAAEALKIHRNTLRNKIIEYGIRRPMPHTSGH